MKKFLGSLAILLSLNSYVRADITVVDNAYSVNSFFSQGNGSIVSFDWSSGGQLYYMTATDSFNFGGFYQAGVSSPLVAGNSKFSGASVIAIGDYMYYNNNDFSGQYIYKYGPTTGAGSAAQVSTTTNYGLYAHQGSMFITGAPGFGTNHIYNSNVAPNGDLVSGNSAIDLGETSGGSGPLAFDAAGDLYYAPGFSDQSIYKWSAAEVAAAIADPSGHALSATGHQWADYSSLYPEVGGGTSMLIDDDGNVLLTLTSFSDPSVLASFGVGESGAYSGTAQTILTDTGILGELREHDGTIYLSSDNMIYTVVPEPGTIALLVAGLLAVVWHRGRRMRKDFQLPLGLSAFVALLSLMPRSEAGIYAQGLNDPTNAYDAPIAGFVGPAGDGQAPISGDNGNVVNPIFKGWATGVVDYAPSPGVSAGFADSSKTLGPVTGDNFDVASLGDLYDPAHPPTSGGVPVNPANTTDGFGFIGVDAPGHITLSFNRPITNGAGADFAIFENAFISGFTTSDGSRVGQIFADLGYVEVSTDGINFVIFPSVSNTPARVGAFGTVDPTDVYNLAGKTVNANGDSWGTPFNLDDLANDPLVQSGVVDLSNINYVKIVDIPGSGDFLDSNGHPIYDSWTTMGSGGLDLEAVGVINQVPEPTTVLLVSIGGALFWLRQPHSRETRSLA